METWDFTELRHFNRLIGINLKRSGFLTDSRPCYLFLTDGFPDSNTIKTYQDCMHRKLGYNHSCR